MNNQKATKLNAKDQEIESLKKQINYQKAQIESARNDYRDLLRDYNTFVRKTDERVVNLVQDNNFKYAELVKIKSHWLYKLIKRFS